MRWQLPEHNHSGSVIERLLQARGISTADHPRFLTPSVEHIHDASLLFDTDRAADLILEHVKAGKKIFIHGDYDVDGVCATSLMWMFLARELKADVLPRVPNRFDEGYGLSPATLDDIVAQGGELVITVDCGVKDGELISQYKQKGLQFVVTDHHTINGELLADVPVVHPRHPQGSYPFTEICGTTVAWKLCQVLARKAGLERPDLAKYLDLVALATVCDVMPLIDENRVIVRLGMAEIQKGPRPGIAALMEVGGVKPSELRAHHFGFMIGPKLNAAGRIQDAMLAVRLLSTDNMANAREWAQELNTLNQERQGLTMKLLQDAEQQIATFPPDSKLYFVHGEDWPEGIVGLVAGKLTEKYNRPVLVASSSSEGVVKGSARSIKAFHIASALQKLEHLLVRHGGHAMAAGFTLDHSKLDEFTAALHEVAEQGIQPDDLIPMLNIDLVLKMHEIGIDVIDELRQLEPYGFGNPNPVVAIMDLEIARSPRLFGSDKQHISFLVHDGKGNQFEVIDWSGSQRWGHLKPLDRVSVAGTLGLNEWNGNRNPQIIVKDIDCDRI
jgi:single-stranded-DNA-specific exonuclease